MTKCATCGVYRCKENGPEFPGFCPGKNEEELIREAITCYENEDRGTAHAAAEVEATGYGSWPRVREIMEFAKRLGNKKIGLAFCLGLRQEARIFADILTANGFEVVSAICKTGAVDKEVIGISPQCKVNPGQFEAICNPAAQAAILDNAGSELSVLLGLCVGHDTLFIKHSKAPVTTLAVKDRVLAHNPLGALYAGHYYHKKLKGINK
ncbi:DUF1847 domain-containing protein [Dethiobacter alkaliphilus]|uniref:DUF1847 domain-containing protein n=1 Tax=Dethiobacter alkaliphilus TaxID=427926 RepID=UPI00222775D5|nr:DUF1847 domain-containing protein [Dethiobacter alkaliphilus]MCW3489960.1 DUF1847 domain-containing protein [Dethiobacter alkaliphilus]